MHKIARGPIVDFFRADGNHQLSFVVTYGDNEYPKIGLRHQSYGQAAVSELLRHMPFVAIVDPRLPPDQAVYTTIDRLEAGWPVDALVTVMSALRTLPSGVTDSEVVRDTLLAALPENSKVDIRLWQKEE